MIVAKESRWRQRLEKELAFRVEFEELDESDWRRILKTRRVTSRNHDTVLALDWPHFCAHATQACGGPQGWCYTFQGNQAGKLHNRHVAMVDILARKYPEVFADKVSAEVQEAVKQGSMSYPNLRYSGSGEVVEAYVPALQKIVDRGVHLWGFTRNLSLACRLRAMGAGVIISCDKTTAPDLIKSARSEKLPLAYSSMGVEDSPPIGTIVTFPVHRVGRVREVVDAPSLCPKVVADFLYDSRPSGSCQHVCKRCHSPNKQC